MSACFTRAGTVIALVYRSGREATKRDEAFAVWLRNTRPELTRSDAMRHSDRRVLSVQTAMALGRAEKAQAAQELVNKGSATVKRHGILQFRAGP
jgi:hypothetical protein